MTRGYGVTRKPASSLRIVGCPSSTSHRSGISPCIRPPAGLSSLYNGEIYNFEDLRRSLEASGRAPVWRGHSDTEVLLAAIEAWGFEGAVSRTIGMFAIALWDRERHILTLARDRLGEKPLYYGQVGSVFCFASELKAVRAVRGQQLEIDRRAVARLMQFALRALADEHLQGPEQTCARTLRADREGSVDWRTQGVLGPW